MSEFISGNAGIIKKEDIVFLEILEPNPFFLKDEYKIYATTYTLDKGERKVLLESRKKYKEIEKEFNRIKKEVENTVKKKICWKPKEQETYYYVGISVYNSTMKEGNKRLVGILGKVIYNYLKVKQLDN